MVWPFFEVTKEGDVVLGVCEPYFGQRRSCAGTEQPRFSRVPLYEDEIARARASI